MKDKEKFLSDYIFPTEEQIDHVLTFEEQVDSILSGADSESSHLQVLKETPPLLRVLGVPNLPILMTAKHLKDITKASGKDKHVNYHDLDIDSIVKRLPEQLKDPVMVMDSLTRDDSIVVLMQMTDKGNNPIIVAIKLSGEGNLNGEKINANILTSAYGKENFKAFIENNIKSGKVLYVSKEKSQEMFEIPGIQFPDSLQTLDFNTIIRKTNAFVNSLDEKSSKKFSSEENMNTQKENNNLEETKNSIKKIRENIVNTLIESIEKDPKQWQKGWHSMGAMPCNGKTEKNYKGINALYLAIIGAMNGYKDNRWVTYNQAQDLGASIKKGEKSCHVLYYDLYDKLTKKSYDPDTCKDMTDEEAREYFYENVHGIAKYSQVFNAEQCNNFPERKIEKTMSDEELAKQNDKIETIIKNSSAPIYYDGNGRAYYSITNDTIHLPQISDFNTKQDYYATALHEISHSTGHTSRLNRGFSTSETQEDYAIEELRAELACVFLQMEHGIVLDGSHIENHASYLNSWLKVVKNDSSVFSKAVNDAEKIADYIIENYSEAQSSTVKKTGNNRKEQGQQETTIAEKLQNKTIWRKVSLSNSCMGGEYGSNTLIRMPENSEYSHFGVFIPTKFVTRNKESIEINIGSEFNYRLSNDGREVNLTGEELAESFSGKTIDKKPIRVAPSKKNMQVLNNLEKNVPTELKEIPLWCCYRTQWNEEKGKKDKFMISTVDGKWASLKDSSKWVTFDSALKYAKENNCEGLSLLLDKKYGITCVDLDKCVVDADKGEYKGRATKLIKDLDGTYMERSTSGNGVHIFLKDDILKDGKYRNSSTDATRGDLEVFDDKRIICMTGDMFSKSNTLTRANSATTLYLREELGVKQQITSNTPNASITTNLTDRELIDRIGRSKKATEFNDLYNGRGISGDKSVDDAKIANILLYFNNGDKDQTFRIMRGCGINREDKPDAYYRTTIDNICAKINFYTPKTDAGKSKSKFKKNNSQSDK